MKTKRIGIVSGLLVLIFIFVASTRAHFPTVFGVGYSSPTSARSFNVLLISESYSPSSSLSIEMYTEAINLLRDRGIGVKAITKLSYATNISFYDVVMLDIYRPYNVLGQVEYYSEIEAEILKNYVSSGGGLVITRHSSYLDAYDMWISDYGCLVDRVHSGRGGVAVTNHIITENVWDVYASGSALILSNPDWIPIVVSNDPLEWETDEHLPVLAVRPLGTGRVAITGTISPFKSTSRDNWILFLNLVYWLGQRPLPEIYNEPSEIIIPPLPPFLSDLTVTPSELERGDNVTIGLDVMNPNNRSITYILTILVEGIGQMSAQIEDVTLFVDVELEAYESETVQHTITPDVAGDYNVTVDGMTGSFVVVKPPLPANFVVSDLEASPNEVEEGENVTFTVLVINDGDTEGTYTIEFKVDGETIDIQNVTVAADSSLHVRAYYEALKAGASQADTNLAPHQVSVGDLTETFMVLSGPFKFAEFVLSNFNYTSELQEGEPLRIYVDIANIGELAGETTIIIKIDGAIQPAPQSLQSLFQLGPEEVLNQVWTSYQPFEVGTHTIHLDGFEGTFNVIAKPPFWNNPELVMAVIVIIIGIIAIYIWRRWGFEDIEHIPPFYTHGSAIAR